MRILLATGLYPPDIGGPATYSKMLEQYLAEQDIEVRIAPYGWVRRYPRIIRHLIFTWKLSREVKECDLFYALDPVSVGLPVYLAHKLSGKPYLLRVAGDYAWEQGQQRFGVTSSLDEFVEEKQHSFFVAFLVRVERFIAQRAIHIVVPSNYLKEIVKKWGIDEAKLTVIYSALHPLMVKETREEIRKMFKYKGVVLVTAGRLVPWKGMKTLIELMPQLITELKSVTLVVIGDGPLMRDLKKLAFGMGVRDQVRFVGSLPKDTLGTAIRGADIFVLNTQYEGLSHQLLEVMDVGVPVVTTNVGGNPELITDGITGLLVPFDDKEEIKRAILRLATQEQLPTELVQRARLRTKEFEEQKVVGELAHLLKHSISTRSTYERH